MAFAAFAAIGLLSTPAPAAAQTGTIVGTVTEAASERPLESAQVFIEGTGIGTLTNASGRFLLVNVPVGEHTVTAELVGYRSASQTVSVSAGESAVANLALAQQAIALDQIVVTGAGVATEKKRLGNTISTISTETMENAPITNFSDLIQGREPGLVGLPSSGTTGEGARIRIRGSSSLSMSNEPIVYVDGVRVDNGGGFGFDGNNNAVSAGGQGSPSRLDDIPPDAIERIEVLKGAAAATLYGTEASNGVIQIFTKRGRQGEPRWTFQTDQALLDTPLGKMTPHAGFPGRLDQLDDDDPTTFDVVDADEQIARMQGRFGVTLQPFEVHTVNMFPEVLETGYSQTYSGSVQGGGDLITYFASGRYSNEDGVQGFEEEVPVRDTNVKRQATANINIFPTDDLRLRVSGLYSEVNHETPNNSNNIFGFFASVFSGHPRLATDGNRFGSLAFGTTKEFGQQITTQDTEHFAGSVNANWTLSEGIVFDGTFGIDVTNQQSVEFAPFGWDVDGFTTNDTEGFRNLNDRNRREVTGDFKLSYQEQFTDEFSSSLVVGAQGFLRQLTQSGGFVDSFPGPGFEVLGAAANQEVFEDFLREVNAGLFAQEQIGYRDWAFLTMGIRADANSAFGEDFDVAYYPKGSLSVVPSDFDAWDSELVSTFRVRAAVGQSGLQPGAFDKLTTFESLSGQDGAGVAPDNLGNDALKPEVSTEWEVGAEVGLWNDRAGVDVTYWNRTVNDALVSRQFPLTGGFRDEQLVNIGQVTGQGVEIAVNGTVYETRDYDLSLFANASWLDEEVTDLGEAPPLKTGGSYPRYRNFIREGYAPGAFFGSTPADVAIPLQAADMAGAGLCNEPTREEALAFFENPRKLGEFEVLSQTFDLDTNTVGPPGGPGCPGNFLANPLGKPTPDWQGSFGFNFTFLSNFELSTLLEYKYGNYKVQDLSGMFRQSNPVIGRNTPASARVESTIENPASSAEERLEAALEWANELRALAPMSGMNGIHDADWLRFRELSLTYRVPSDFVNQLRLDNATVTFGVRNLALFLNDDYTGMDPEVNILGRCAEADLDCNFLSSVEGWGVPIPRRYSLSLRVGF